MLKLFKGVISAVFLLMYCLMLPGQSRLYVNVASSCGDECGSSWEAALPNLQDALAAAKADTSIREIWVAQGIYHPDEANQNVSFEIRNGLQLIGGFAGTGADPDERDVNAHETILSGDLLEDDQEGFLNYQDNSYHVIVTREVDSTTLVDGFTITGGNAVMPGGSNLDAGGGWYNYQYKGISSPTVRNCRFVNNQALRNGGAFYSGGKFGRIDPVFTNCLFSGNQARTGGAIYNNANSNQGSPKFNNCIFLANSAVGPGAVGGVIYSFSRANIENGTVYESYAHPDFSNCIFAGNSSDHNAGTLYFLADGTGGVAESFPVIRNCSFYANSASVGGAVYLNGSHEGTNVAEIQNCIFWDSRSTNDPLFHYSKAGDGPSPVINISYSLVDTDNCDHLIPDGLGEVNCANLFFLTDSTTPMFVDPDNGDFHLIPGSPAVNAGSNDLVYSSTDFEGQVRIQEDIVDLGADEVEARATPVNEPAFQYFSLYPNPVTDRLRVQWFEPLTASFPYQIFNQLGQSLRTGEINLINGAASLENLDQHLPPGSYFLRFAGQTHRLLKL